MVHLLADATTDGGAAVGGGLSLLFIVFIFGLYWIPPIIALSRHTGNKCGQS
jgi:hypothetical protein